MNAAQPESDAKPVLARAGAYLVDRFAIDTRTLALFRILAGLIIIGDILARSGRFSFFYTEDGVVPQWLAEERTADHAFSLLFLTTSSWLILGIFILHALVAAQLIIGYRTTIATILSFVFVISFDHANPFITSYADVLFRLLMFWAMFLPLGERWSVDAVLRGEPPRPKIVNLASAAILLQMIYMYVANGLQKSTSDFWTSGVATPLIFGLDDMTYFLADLLRRFPTMLEYGGLTWYYMLLSSWLLLILPARLRMLFTFAFIIAHASFIMTVRIGGFGYVAIAGVTLFLPAVFWEDLSRAAKHLNLDRASLKARVEKIRVRLVSIAQRFPRLPDTRLVPDYVRDGIHTTLVTAAIIAVLIVPPLSVANEHGYTDVDFEGLEQSMSTYTRAINVRQPPWTVFAPVPRTTDRYYVFPALAADGTLYDAYNDRELTFERPHRHLQKQYRNYRERFYMNSVRRDGERSGAIPGVLAEYICRTWYEERGIELTHVTMWSINERVTLETIRDPAGRERTSTLFYEYGCGENEPMELERPDF
jgi:hypothetical protein